MHEKIYKCVFVVMLLLWVIALAGFAVQTYRVSRLESELGLAGARLEQFEAEQSRTKELIDDSERIVLRASGTVAEIRAQIKDIQDAYFELWMLYHNSDNNIDTDEEINNR